jgi:hypothetical protein
MVLAEWRVVAENFAVDRFLQEFQELTPSRAARFLETPFWGVEMPLQEVSSGIFRRNRSPAEADHRFRCDVDRLAAA